LSDEEALAAIARVVDYYKANAQKGERLGKMIDRLGFDKVTADLVK
jgi:dissimilatory sulfite reductase (desulfoviridin) alpha/beta subunit